MAQWRRHPENKYIVCKVDVKFNELGYLQICILNDAEKLGARDDCQRKGETVAESKRNRYQKVLNGTQKKLMIN